MSKENEFVVHTCADCGHDVAMILDDGIPFPLCDKCRKEMYAWFDECAWVSELQAVLDQFDEDYYNKFVMKSGDS